jgi:hypothetical protein
MYLSLTGFMNSFNPSNAELNPICHLLALLGAHHILHVSRIRVKTVKSHYSVTVSSNVSHNFALERIFLKVLNNNVLLKK